MLSKLVHIVGFSNMSHLITFLSYALDNPTRITNKSHFFPYFKTGKPAVIPLTNRHAIDKTENESTQNNQLHSIADKVLLFLVYLGGP